MVERVFAAVIFLVIVQIAKSEVSLEQNSSEETSTEKAILIGRQRKPSLALEDDYYYDSVSTSEDEYLILAEDRLRHCGNEDICPAEPDSPKLAQASGNFPGRDKVKIDFQRNPFKCRCDAEACSQYGDCCWETIAKLTTPKNKLNLEERNPWKCHPLQPRQRSPIWALMISECPKEFMDEDLTLLCSAEKSDIPEGRRNYLVDLPAFSNKSGILYKNIYCARCHNEKGGDMLQLTLQLFCNKAFTPEQRVRFQDKAKYQTGNWSWADGNGTLCYLSAKELYNPLLQQYVPNVRYCGFNTIDRCPMTGNFSTKTRRLCSSYSQYVIGKVDKVKYKNPHCYACNVDQLYQKGNVTEPDCFRYLPPNIFFRVVPGGPPEHGVGLNFLFDFSFGDDQYVGYNMLCHEDEVWDYVRHQCHPMVCGKDHILKTGVCKPANETVSDGDKGNSGGEPSESLEKEPECYRILLNESDYKVVSENLTIAILLNRSDSGEAAVLHLEKSDYEKWNETHISICAKFLSSAFESRFTALLSYLSLVAVGLSLTFLFLHMVLFVCLPQLRNLPARNLFGLTLSLFISQFILLVFIGHPEWKGVCVTAAILMHYFFLAAFFWMNIMSFDIWRTFAGGIMMRRHSSESRNSAFVKYSAFAWITPLLIVSLAVITDFGLPIIGASWVDADIMSRVKPSYGENGLCWISQRLALFIFFAVPVALVIFSNLVLFSLTAMAILSQHREASRVLKGMEAKTRQVQPSSANTDEVRLKLYVKLALIMGLTWVLGFLSTLLWDWLWYFFVVLNGLQGTFIFVAFDFKWKVWEMVRERFDKLTGRKPSSSGIPRRGTTTSSSSGIRTTNVVSFSLGAKEEEC